MKLWIPPPENLGAMNNGLAVVLRKHKRRQQVVGPVRSDCHELYAIVQGTLEVGQGRRRHTAEAQSIVFNRRRTTIRITQAKAYRGPVRIVSILFRAPAGWRIRWDGSPRCLSEVWWRRFLDLESSSGFDEHGQRVLAVKLVMAFIDDFVNRMFAKPDDRTALRSDVATDWLRAWVLAEDVIRERTREGLTVAELARAVGVSPTQLRRIFHATRGASPKSVLTKWRIETAKKLLATGQLNISEIAREVGYATIQRFSAAFKELEGVSPGRFAKK